MCSHLKINSHTNTQSDRVNNTGYTFDSPGLPLSGALVLGVKFENQQEFSRTATPTLLHITSFLSGTVRGNRENV